MTEKDEILIEMLKRNDFEDADINIVDGRYWFDLEVLIRDVTNDRLEAFYLGMDNYTNDIAENYYLYTYDSANNEITQYEREDILDSTNIPDFLEKYVEDYGEEDSLYRKYLTACV